MDSFLEQHRDKPAPAPAPYESPAAAPYRAAIFGTFDIENYGDLLFPLIAQAQLAARLPHVALVPYSYHARRAPAWHMDVAPIADFAADAAAYDAVLIGGGHIIRFDKDVAYGYQPPNAGIHHPTGYWLAPALIAQQRDIPVIWNAPGFHGEIPGWAAPLLRLALANCSAACVRDAASVNALRTALPELPLPLVPDSAFGLPLLVNPAAPSPGFAALRSRLGLTKPYIFIQAAAYRMEFVQDLVARQAAEFADRQFVLAPIGRGVGDGTQYFPVTAPNLLKLEDFPGPLLMAELIANAEGAIGQSYHLAITAMSFGVPFFSTISLCHGKLEDFGGWAGNHTLPRGAAIHPAWVASRLGRRPVAPEVAAAQAASGAYWDRVAGIIRNGGARSSPALNRYWMRLPQILEDAAQETATLRQRLQAAAPPPPPSPPLSTPDAAAGAAQLAQLAAAAAQSAARAAQAEAALARIQHCRSMRLTAPLRALNHLRLVLKGRG